MSEFESQFGEKDFDFKRLILGIKKFWYIIPAFLLVSLAVAIYSYKTTLPKYRVSTQILISGGEKARSAIGISEGEGAMPGIQLGSTSNLETQLVLLTSYKQIEKTLKQLDFGISYYEVGFFQTSEIYKNTPFKVILDTLNLKVRDMTFNVKFLSKEQFELSIVGDKNYKQTHKFFESIKTPYFSMSIVPVPGNFERTPYYEREYKFKVNSLHSLVLNYKSKIVLELVKKGSTITEVSLVENNVQKGVDFLNRLAQTSVNYTLEKKNQIAVNTISFIEKELLGVSDSLVAAGKVLEDFRSRNEVMDVSIQGQMIIKQSQDLESQRAAIALKLDYYNYLVDYLQSNGNVQDLMVPSAMGVEDGLLTKLIAELSAANAAKSSMQFSSKVANPNITKIDHQIQTLKTAILENTRSLIETTNLALRDMDNRMMNVSGQLRRLPKTEQMLLGIERKFRLSDEMYTFLMERRSEAQLAKAANLPDNEVIEEGFVREQVAPDTMRSIIIVFMVGLFLPFVIIFMLVYFNNKIQDENDIEFLTKHPVSGQIPFEKNAISAEYIFKNPKTVMAEAYRSLRTSLGYFTHNSANQVFLVTSVIPGEGKSFCASNLAAIYAGLGKKTLVMGFDLRKPALGKNFGVDDKISGVTDFYLVNDDRQLLVTPTNIPNLDLLLSGPIPPNPAELIAGDVTKKLFNTLREKYEVIIIDTPPLGLVSDAHLLTEFCDVSIIVVRHNYTPKGVLKQVLQDSKVQKIKNLTFVLNGLPNNKGGYSYASGYGNDYYAS